MVPFQKKKTFYPLSNCNQKRRELPQNTHRYPSNLPGLYHLHSKPQTLLFPWLLTTQELLCRTTQCNFRSHKWSVQTSCLTTQKLFCMWAQIEHLQCTCTARHDGQTPFHFTINFLSFISQKTLQQHKLPDPYHHLICSTTLRSEAGTCHSNSTSFQTLTII